MKIEVSEETKFMNRPPRFNFQDSNTPHDGIIASGGNMFHVNIGLVSVWSEDLRRRFEDPNVSKLFDKPWVYVNRIPMYDLNEFLHFIYPGKFEIYEENLKTLVTMAVRFQAPGALAKCKDFINKKFEYLDKIKLLELACEQNLDDVKECTKDYILSVLPSTIDLLELIKIAFKYKLDDVKRNVRTVLFAMELQSGYKLSHSRCSLCRNGFEGNCPSNKDNNRLFHPFIFERIEEITELPCEIKDFIYRSICRSQ